MHTRVSYVSALNQYIRGTRLRSL